MANRAFGIVLLVALLFVVYTLTSAGKFHIVDEVSLFSVTESLAQRGTVDTNAIAWTQWVNSPGEVLGAFGPDGQVYSKKGPAPAFVAVPWYLLLRTIAQLEIGIGLVQGMLLWNGVITALTAALLWLTALRLGYSDRVGLILGLLFGLCTIAWPYANHFFGEPLSALSLLLCFYAIRTFRTAAQVRWLWLAGVAAGVAVGAATEWVIQACGVAATEWAAAAGVAAGVVVEWVAVVECGEDPEAKSKILILDNKSQRLNAFPQDQRLNLNNN